MDEIQKANDYIANAKNSVNGKYRLKYHVMPPVGWMNDPNGLVWFNGKYHLYYQFNPYDTHTGKMCWGHVVSDDLISYTACGVALMHEGEHDRVFSGGSIETDGGITAYYTLHIENGEENSEEVYKATSCDGTEFKNSIKVFDNENLPENLSRTDFRDPCPVKIGDTYYVFIGGKDVALNRGVIIVLAGKTTDKLEYKFHLGPYYELGDMGECPSYFKVDGKDVIIASGCHVHDRGNDFKNTNSSVFIVGDLDFDKGEMKVDFIKEIDKGDTFYAPQFIRGIDKPVMIGWFEMWDKPYPTKDMGHGWVGAFTLPRELEYRDGDIFQKPVESLNAYLYEPDTGEVPKCADISFKFFGQGSLIIEGSNGKVVIGNDGGIYLDTRFTNNSFGSIRRTNGSYCRCTVRALLDVSGVEVFVDGGREAISSRIYIDGDYRVRTSGGVSGLKIKGIGGKQ
jgi:beta-fructofuranosidase